MGSKHTHIINTVLTKIVENWKLGGGGGKAMNIAFNNLDGIKLELCLAI